MSKIPIVAFALKAYNIIEEDLDARQDEKSLALKLIEQIDRVMPRPLLIEAGKRYREAYSGSTLVAWLKETDHNQLLRVKYKKDNGEESLLTFTRRLYYGA